LPGEGGGEDGKRLLSYNRYKMRVIPRVFSNGLGRPLPVFSKRCAAYRLGRAVSKSRWCF